MFGLSPVVTAVIGLVVLLVLLALLVTTRYKVAGPNESFIITGRKGKGEVRNPETGFVQVQRNLRLDELNEYIRHTSSAVFACPPGVEGDDDWWGRALFEG